MIHCWISIIIHPFSLFSLNVNFLIRKNQKRRKLDRAGSSEKYKWDKPQTKQFFNINIIKQYLLFHHIISWQGACYVVLRLIELSISLVYCTRRTKSVFEEELASPIGIWMLSPFLFVKVIIFDSVLRSSCVSSRKSTWISLLLSRKTTACFVFIHCLTKMGYILFEDVLSFGSLCSEFRYTLKC